MTLVLEERTERVSMRAACQTLGLPRSSAHHRRTAPRRLACDKPAGRWRARHPRALDTDENEAILALLNSDAYAEQAPGQIYASELEQGRYHCSVRTMQRLVKVLVRMGWGPMRPSAK